MKNGKFTQIVLPGLVATLIVASGLVSLIPSPAQSATSKPTTQGCKAWAMSLIPEDKRPTNQDQYLDFLWSYQQTEPNDRDPMGDFVLVQLDKTLPGKIVRKLGFNDPNHGIDPSLQHPGYDVDAPMEPKAISAAPTEDEIRAMNISESEKDKMLVDLQNSHLTIEGSLNPIRKKQMVDAFVQVIREETQKGIAPSEGTEQTWSPEYLKNCPEKVYGINGSKLLLALIRGDASKFLITGSEKDLEAWTLSQANGSVTPDVIFRKSYELNRGNVYKTLLTIENILSRNWRNPHREDLALIHRLAPIANFYEGRGTNFGVWYHFFGIMLFGYVDNGFEGWMIGNVEHVGSVILGRFAPQMQKGAVNSAGGWVGAGLKKALRKDLMDKQLNNPQALDPSVYLNLTEDFRDRIAVFSDPAFNVKVNDQKIEITSLEKDLNSCDIEIIFNLGQGFEGGRKVNFRGIQLPKQKATSVLVPYQAIQGVRVFIEGCDQ